VYSAHRFEEGQGQAWTVASDAISIPVVDSAHRFEEGREQAWTVASAALSIPTDRQDLARVLASLVGCDATSVTWCPTFRRNVMPSFSGVDNSLYWCWKMKTAFPSKRREALI
jgi:hypothetical protein